MKYKSGEIVILISAKNPSMKKYIGTIRTLKVPCGVYENAWDLEPPVFDSRGIEGSWKEFDMIPIRDSNGEDEMLKIAGYPRITEKEKQ